MGFWLLAAIALQLACTYCAHKLNRPVAWLQIILLVPVFGALAFCCLEAVRALRSRTARPAPTRQQPPWPAGTKGGPVYRAVSTRTVEGRLALAEECMLIGRHADARLLFESCRTADDTEDREISARVLSAEAEMDQSTGKAD